jgi:uncharacterized SAM-binding protein YcdF (DUF218 family)
MEERGFERLILVTSPLHTLRASLAFQTVGLEVTTVAAAEPRYDLEGMSRVGDRLRAFGPVLHERLGLIWYRRRGWIR